MYTAEFYRENKYLFSKVFENLVDIQEASDNSRLNVDVYDQDRELLRRYQPERRL